MPATDWIRASQVDTGILLVKLNRPPHNFITHPLVAAIADAYEAFAADPQARVIVLAAEGKNFCAGADFSGIAAETRPAEGPTPLAADTVYETYGQGARIVAAPLPVVAAINGAAVGGGFGLVCTADFRVGSPATRLAPNFARLGVHHGFGLTVTLPLIVGFQRANELLLTGRRIAGEEAHHIGLLDRLVEDVELEAAAIVFAREIAASAPLSIRAIRATMRQGLADRFRAAAKWESQEQARLGSTEDFREGVRASAERREPRFEGR